MDEKFRKYLPLIIPILEKNFKGTGAKVFLCGSRARLQANYGSDIDLLVKAPQIMSYKMSVAREDFFESHIPYKVDLLEWKTASGELKENIKSIEAAEPH